MHAHRVDRRGQLDRARRHPGGSVTRAPGWSRRQQPAVGAVAGRGSPRAAMRDRAHAPSTAATEPGIPITGSSPEPSSTAAGPRRGRPGGRARRAASGSHLATLGGGDGRQDADLLGHLLAQDAAGTSSSTRPKRGGRRTTPARRASPRARTAPAQTACIVAGVPAWKPQATLALVTTASRPSSSVTSSPGRR